MVRRSVLVYDLLRSEQPPDGFSPKEILTRITSKYNIAASKTLQRDIAVALRRGLDFGILAKKRNKFRFEPSSRQSARHNVIRTNTRTKRSRTKSRRKKTNGRSSVTKGRRRSSTRGRNRKQPAKTPRPKLPKPPSWSPKRRILSEEPMPKVIKHS